jgi:hypothetical protein
VPDYELPRRRPRDVRDHLQPTAAQGATVRFNSHFDHHLAGRSVSPHASRRPAEERLISLRRSSNRSRPGQTTRVCSRTEMLSGGGRHRLADRLGEHEADVLLHDLELLYVAGAPRHEEVDQALDEFLGSAGS